MKAKYAVILYTAIGSLSFIASADTQFAGSLSFEQRYFPQDAEYESQPSLQASIAFQPEWYGDLSSDLQFSFTPFARLDQHDDERTHVDIRELKLSHYRDAFELNVGINKVFWGQTESIHLVDIINQSDLVEAVDGEQKLGQPMIDMHYHSSLGSFSMYWMPYFRERSFAGADGRLRGPLIVDHELVRYESSDEQGNIDFALRWQASIDDLELGIAYFDGTARAPEFSVQTNSAGRFVLAPFYAQITQFSLDGLYLLGDWLLKFEAISNDSFRGRYSAAVTGFEYNIVSVADTTWDLGLLAEYQYDERRYDPNILGQNDLMLGARVMLNDFASSELLIGIIRDLDAQENQQIFVEGATRINANWRLEINGYFFSAEQESEPLYPIRKDDHISLGVEYYF